MKSSPHLFTELLRQWNDGDETAIGHLMPLVHDELHRLAHQHRKRESPGPILQTSALINEAYLRLVDEPQIRWENPGTVMHDWTFARAWLRNEMSRA